MRNVARCAFLPGESVGKEVINVKARPNNMPHSLATLLRRPSFRRPSFRRPSHSSPSRLAKEFASHGARPMCSINMEIYAPDQKPWSLPFRREAKKVIGRGRIGFTLFRFDQHLARLQRTTALMAIQVSLRHIALVLVLLL